MTLAEDKQLAPPPKSSTAARAQIKQPRARSGPRPKIIVIGAGIGGLTSAASLARYGDVTVLERQAQSGGKVRQADIGNQQIDSGPTVFTLLPVFEELFSACGFDFHDFVRVLPLDVLARHAWQDGGALDLFADRTATLDALRDFAGPQNADGYRRFLRHAGRTWRTLYKSFIRQPKPNMLRLILGSNPVQLASLDPYADLYSRLGNYFDDSRLKQLFGRYATYCGCSPFKAPATLMLIAHLEQEGVWAVDGGMQRVASAVEEIARLQGVSFDFNTHVRRIHRDGKAYRIETDGGSAFAADIIVHNGDISALMTGLLGKDATRALPAREMRERTQSAMTFSFVGTAAGITPSVHNVFFSSDYEQEFTDVFDRAQVPTAPTTYVFAPDRAADAAPDGEERFFCLINAPATGDTHHYTPEESSVCEERMHSLLKACGLDLTPIAETKAVATPTTFAERFPATGGALFGMPNHGWRASFQRPGIQTKLPGFYCVGGSVHPGAGVPMAALSGLMAAKLIMRDYALTDQLSRAATRGGT